MSADAPYHELTRAVAHGLRRRCGVRAGTHLLAAVSGGADSVAMLRVLATLAGRRRWALTITVGHVQHHLRGDAAEADARFVENLAAEQGLAYRRLDVHPTREHGNVEAVARRLRYAALARMAEACGAEAIVTAHHADDQLETLLLRIARGTSVTGLRGIAWRRRVAGADAMLVRPMLGATRAQVIDFLERVNQPWREDHTNEDVTRDRARLRRDVLPVLREIGGDAAARAVQLADHARDVNRLVEREIDRQHEAIVSATRNGWTLGRGAARTLPRVVLKGLLRRVLSDAGVARDRLSSDAIAPVTRAVRDRRGGERRFELAGGVRVSVTREAVEVEKPVPPGPAV